MADISLTNTGTITVSGNGIVADDVTITNVTIDVFNSGTVTAAGYGVLITATDLGYFGTVNVTNTSTGAIHGGHDGLKITADTLNPAATGDFVLNNAGLIESTGTGHGVNFGDLISPLETVTLTNAGSGIIRAADATAILAGANDTINNYGLITGQLRPAGSNGIDFQSNGGGVVNNFTGASIAGAKYGITGTQPLTVINTGLIAGYAGSGINIETASNAATTIIENFGTIFGASVASAPSGDAINVNGIVQIDNSGVIEAVGTSPGTLAEAISVGGGLIVNYAGGTIYSSQRAITVDGGGTADNTGLSAFSKATIANYGTIQGNNGEAIVIVGNFADTIVNAGTIIGSVSTDGGNDTFDLVTGSSISGLLDGGAGTDTVNLLGSGVGTLASFAGIETIDLFGGDWTLGSEGINSLVFEPGSANAAA